MSINIYDYQYDIKHVEPKDKTKEYNEAYDQVISDPLFLLHIFSTQAEEEKGDILIELMNAYKRFKASDRNSDAISLASNFSKIMDTAIEEEADARL